VSTVDAQDTVTDSADQAHGPERSRVVGGLVTYAVLVLLVFAAAVVLSIFAGGGLLIWWITLFGAVVISAIIGSALPGILNGE
jgi:hypothetical protein